MARPRRGVLETKIINKPDRALDDDRVNWICVEEGGEWLLWEPDWFVQSTLLAEGARMLAPETGSVLEAVAGANARLGAAEFGGRVTDVTPNGRGRSPGPARQRGGENPRPWSRASSRTSSCSSGSGKSATRHGCPGARRSTSAAFGRNGPRSASRRPPSLPACSAPSRDDNQKMLSIHADLLEQLECGDWMSLIGGRFRIRLPEVRKCFVVSDVTASDAWISTVPHSNLYFVGLEDDVTSQSLREDCRRFDSVLNVRIIASGRRTRCAMVKFATIRGALAASTGLQATRPAWDVRCAERDAGPASDF